MSNELNEEQKKAFAKVNERLGLGPEEYTFSQEDLPSKGPVVFSADPLKSTVPPKLVPVGSIAEMKKMVGSDDNDDDSHVNYPPPADNKIIDLPKSAKSRFEFRQGLDDESRENLRQATSAYIFGKSHKIKEYEPVANALYFPGHIAVFTAKDLTVLAGTTYDIGKDGVQYLNFGTVTVQAGGCIQVFGDSKFTCQIFIQEG